MEVSFKGKIDENSSDSSSTVEDVFDIKSVASKPSIPQLVMASRVNVSTSSSSSANMPSSFGALDIFTQSLLEMLPRKQLPRHMMLLKMQILIPTWIKRRMTKLQEIIGLHL